LHFVPSPWCLPWHLHLHLFLSVSALKHLLLQIPSQGFSSESVIGMEIGFCDATAANWLPSRGLLEELLILDGFVHVEETLGDAEAVDFLEGWVVAVWEILFEAEFADLNLDLNSLLFVWCLDF
jgi:hypothetical protein